MKRSHTLWEASSSRTRVRADGPESATTTPGAPAGTPAASSAASPPAHAAIALPWRNAS